MTQPREPSDDAIPPTHQDRENARLRRQIADRQAEEYGRVLSWAQAAFGAGWLPSHRHFLIAKEEEERARRTSERPEASATVYTVRNAAGEDRHFSVVGGQIVEHAGYADGFGAMLFEPHPTRGFEHQGTWHRTHRYSLCWAPYELYQPRTAEQLAALRAARQRKRAEREEKQWAEENPLLAWAQAVNTEEPAAGREKGRER